ncbi:MAG: 2TM domain-containing protein [Dokdonia sp.]|jgi:hypothetical protein|nr:hypothetical protein [Cytophagaceae bacterium]
MTEEQFKLERARDQVKQLKAFYLHLIIYFTVMTVVLVGALNDYRICFICFKNKSVWYNMLGFIPWSLAVLVHGLIAFRLLKFFDSWERRKLKEFMED